MRKYMPQIFFPSLNRLSFVAILLFFFAASVSSFAKKGSIWDGSHDTNWNNAQNWVGGKVPPSKDNVKIPAGCPFYPVIVTGETIVIKEVSISSGGSLTINGGSLTISKKLKIDGGTFNQTEGTVSIKDLEIKKKGTYNQSSGELNIAHDFKVSTGNTFNSTGGIVHFTGSGKKADYQGDIQFNDVVIDDGVAPKFDQGKSVNIKVSGDYINNNPDLRVTKATFIFNGTGDQTISTATTYGKSTFGNLVIDNSSGTVTMLTDLEVEDTFTETSGTLDLNGKVLTVAGIPVPVELTSFTASKYKNGIMLNWSTATEVNNYGFSVERASTSFSTMSNTSSRAESREWIKIGFVEGHGNSNSPKDYSFYDKSPLKGKSVYRLKQIDTDGAFEYSDEVEITFLQSDKTQLYQNHPNPFNPSTTITFSLTDVSHVTITIYNAIGQKVAELVNEVMNAGMQSVNFNASSLTSGFYFYRFETPNYTKTMKMILLR